MRRGPAADLRTRCDSDPDPLRQIGRAVHNYESARQEIPRMFRHPTFKDPAVAGLFTVLLPYLEQQALYDRYDFTQPFFADRNKEVMEARLSVVNGPSAPALIQTGVGTSVKPTASNATVMAPTTDYYADPARPVARVTITGGENAVPAVELNGPVLTRAAGTGGDRPPRLAHEPFRRRVNGPGARPRSQGERGAGLVLGASVRVRPADDAHAPVTLRSSPSRRPFPRLRSAGQATRAPDRPFRLAPRPVGGIVRPQKGASDGVPDDGPIRWHEPPRR